MAPGSCGLMSILQPLRAGFHCRSPRGSLKLKPSRRLKDICHSPVKRSGHWRGRLAAGSLSRTVTKTQNTKKTNKKAIAEMRAAPGLFRAKGLLGVALAELGAAGKTGSSPMSPATFHTISEVVFLAGNAKEALGSAGASQGATLLSSFADLLTCLRLLALAGKRFKSCCSRSKT